MNSIFGRINRVDTLNVELFNEALKRLTDYPHIAIQEETSDLYGFGQVRFNPTPNLAFINTEDYCIVADCRIDNKEKLMEVIQIKEPTVSDDHIILKAFIKWGVTCPEYLLGDFAFAIWDKQKKELFCARDHFGVKPFFYCFPTESFVFSSEIKALLTQEDLTFTPDEQYIADALSIVKSEKNRTFYSEIKKLPPAHYLTVKNNKLEIKEYWKLVPQKTLALDQEEIIEQFKKILIEAVRCRVSGNEKTGSELSGGLDSSSIAAVASKFTNLYTFSHILPDHVLGKIHPFKDERDFIKQLTDYCQINDSFFITSEESGVVDAIEQNLHDSGYVSQQNFATFSDHLYETAAKYGVTVLLSGFSGDEVITSKSSSYLLDLAKSDCWSEIRKDLKNQELSRIKYYKKILNLIFKVKTPSFYDLLSKLRNSRSWWESKFENLALNKQFLKSMNVKKRYYDYYTQENDLSLQEKNIERITHPHVSQRLEYSSIAAKKRGVEYRFPFLDKRLIEFYLSMPPRLKARNGVVRYAIREAMKEILPESIRLRNDKSGATIPTVFMRMLSDKNKISEIICRAKTNPKINQYIDLDAYEKWFNKLCKRSEKKENSINPGAFYNYLKLLLFIEQNPSLFK